MFDFNEIDSQGIGWKGDAMLPLFLKILGLATLAIVGKVLYDGHARRISSSRS